MSASSIACMHVHFVATANALWAGPYQIRRDQPTECTAIKPSWVSELLVDRRLSPPAAMHGCQPRMPCAASGNVHRVLHGVRGAG